VIANRAGVMGNAQLFMPSAAKLLPRFSFRTSGVLVCRMIAVGAIS
jgi:hypothetical protein